MARTVFCMFKKEHQKLGKRIRKLRKEAGWSMRAFGSMIGLSKDSIYAIEKGRKSPTLDSLCKIAFGLNITLSDLVEDIGPTPRDVMLDGGNEPPITSYRGIKL